MAYRMTDVAMHLDPRVRRLSLGARWLLSWFMTGPLRTSIPGLLAIGPAGISESTGAPMAEVVAALDELVRAQLAEVDTDGNVIRIIDAPSWDGPLNGKIIQSWPRTWSTMRSHLVEKHKPSLRVAAERTCSPETVLQVFGPSPSPPPPPTLSPSPSPAPAPSPSPGVCHTVSDRVSDTVSHRVSTEAASAPSVNPDARIRCPVPVLLSEDTLVNLEMNIGLPQAVARAFLKTWSLKQNVKESDLRTIDAWRATAVAALSGEWSKNRDAMRALAKTAEDEATKKAREAEHQRHVAAFDRRRKREEEERRRKYEEEHPGETPEQARERCERTVRGFVAGFGNQEPVETPEELHTRAQQKKAELFRRFGDGSDEGFTLQSSEARLDHRQ